MRPALAGVAALLACAAIAFLNYHRIITAAEAGSPRAGEIDQPPEFVLPAPATASPSGAAVASSVPTATMPPPPSRSAPWGPNDTVVVAVHNLADRTESVDWLAAQPHPAFVVEMGGPHGLPLTRGGVAAGFTRFIVDHYDELPAVMLFCRASRFLEVPSAPSIVRVLCVACVSGWGVLWRACEPLAAHLFRSLLRCP